MKKVGREPAKRGLLATDKRKKRFSLLTVWILFFLTFPSCALGQVAQIQDILVNSQGGQLFIYARLTNCFTKSMESAIMAGVPTTFTFLIDLYQERSGWANKKIASETVRHTLKYDSVKKSFYVYSSLDRDPAIFQDWASAKRAMSELNGAKLSLRSDLRRDLPHYIMMKAKLDKIRLPLYMEYVFFFVSLWDFETDWYRQPVTF
jgi:hypothetical protein